MNRAIGMAVGLALATSTAAAPYEGSLRSRFQRDIAPEPQKLGWLVEPRIESALMFVGNINLAEDSADEVDVAGIEVAPGIAANYLSSRAQGFLDYSLIGRVWEDDDYDQVSHRLSANGSYLLVPEWFRIGGQATYTDAVVDPTVSYNYGNSGLFGPSNLTERATASVSPQLFHEFRDFRFDARYTYGRVWYLDTPDDSNNLVFSLYQDDSIDQQANVSISTRDDRRAATMRLYYDWQDSEFSRTVDYRYERAGAEVGVDVGREIRLVADGGLESDLDESTTDGGLDSGFWHAGFNWSPDSRTSLDARYGERFFGESWSLSASRDTRYLTVRLSYQEDPQVQTRRIGINFDPDELPLPNPGTDLSGLTSRPYVGKDATLALLAEGARTKLRLDAYDRKRNYVQPLINDERTTGVRFNAIRDIGASLYAEFDTRYEDVLNNVENREIGEPRLVQYYDFNVMGRLSWEAYRNFTTSAEAGYLHRSGERNYDGEWLAFRFRYTFR